MVIIDMACLQDDRVEAKEREKRRKYQQLIYELRTQLIGWRIEFEPSVIGCFGSLNKLEETLTKVLRNNVKWTCSEMQRVVLTMSEGIVRKIKSGLIVE